MDSWCGRNRLVYIGLVERASLLQVSQPVRSYHGVLVHS
jgi:hypothetical protein